MAKILMQDESLKLEFEPTSLHQSRSGSITAQVFFELGGAPFPDAQWSDFPVVIASWWLAALGELDRGVSPVSLRFMDGPYSVVVTRREPGAVLLQALEHRRSEITRGEARVARVALRLEVLRFARRVADECVRRNFVSSDLDALGALLPH